LGFVAAVAHELLTSLAALFCTGENFTDGLSLFLPIRESVTNSWDQARSNLPKSSLGLSSLVEPQQFSPHSRFVRESQGTLAPRAGLLGGWRYLSPPNVNS
jgi:hypothetical protein